MAANFVNLDALIKRQDMGAGENKPPQTIGNIKHTELESGANTYNVLRKPVLITHGQEDRIVLTSAAEQHAAAITHAQLSLYPQVGHAPFWEAPDRFNRELRAFVEAL